jgi:hypothetical protein
MFLLVDPDDQYEDNLQIIAAFETLDDLEKFLTENPRNLSGTRLAWQEWRPGDIAAPHDRGTVTRIEHRSFTFEVNR